jgi:hypothetical protein
MPMAVRLVAATGLGFGIGFAIVWTVLTVSRPPARPAVIPVASASPMVAAAVPSAASPAKRVSPTVVLTLAGTGARSSPAFQAGTDWTLTYTYDCTGRRSAFSVTADGRPRVHEQSTKGSGTVVQHDTPGSHRLAVDSRCSWTVTVTA